MRLFGARALPFLTGFILPWQTVLIFTKLNEFTAIQLFGWQIIIFIWWIREGAPRTRELLVLAGALALPKGDG